MAIPQTRRRFLTMLSLAGAAGLVGGRQALAEEGALETTKVRLSKSPAICLAPQYVAEELLRAEGFTDVEYVDSAISGGWPDFGLNFAVDYILAIERGRPITLLAGVHVGCYELFARDEIHSIAELKGRSVAVTEQNGRTFFALLAAQVGLDSKKDIRWIEAPYPMELFVHGKADAVLGLPPLPQELRSERFGHVLVNTEEDSPWSQYFCCMLVASRDYVRNYPGATKRVLRAILKAADLCANAPARVAQQLIDAGLTDRYDYAAEALREVHYDHWRDYDAEDSVRFYALRLRDAGFIKSSPQKIIAENTDWRFFNEIKRELKA